MSTIVHKIEVNIFEKKESRHCSGFLVREKLFCYSKDEKEDCEIFIFYSFFMSGLNDFMGTLFGGHKYSKVAHTLSEHEIKMLISQTKISSLSQHEVQAVEEALMHGRNGSMMISLSKIDEILKHLEYSRQISRYDRESVMKVFERHLGTR